MPRLTLFDNTILAQFFWKSVDFFGKVWIFLQKCGFYALTGESKAKMRFLALYTVDVE